METVGKIATNTNTLVQTFIDSVERQGCHVVEFELSYDQLGEYEGEIVQPVIKAVLAESSNPRSK